MICVFEDQEGTLLSTFVRNAIPEQVKCFYSNGAKKIKSTLKAIHEAYPEEFIVVYCDLVPNNFETKTTFIGLWNMVAGNNSMHKKVFIAPSLCTEYYYLQSLFKYGLVNENHKGVVGLCLSREPYSNDHRLLEWDHNEYSTHERFCKLLCKVAVKECARTASHENHYYMLRDCFCDADVTPECTELTVYEKSCRVADEWMFRVDGWGNTVLHFDLKSSIENLMLVAEKHNSLVEEYESAGNKTRKTAMINFNILRGLIYASFQDC